MTNTTLELDPQVMRAVEVLYRDAAVAFGSMRVNWWVEVEPSSFGPEVRLQVRSAGGKWLLMLSHRMIVSDEAFLEARIGTRVRELRRGVTELVP